MLLPLDRPGFARNSQELRAFFFMCTKLATLEDSIVTTCFAKRDDPTPLPFAPHHR